MTYLVFVGISVFLFSQVCCSLNQQCCFKSHTESSIDWIIYSLKTCKQISEIFTHRFHVAENSIEMTKKCLAINCCHFLNFIFAANTVIQTVKKNYFIFSKSSTFLVISIFTFCLCISERLFALWISIPFTSTWYNMEKVRHCMNSPPLFLTTFPVNVLIDLVNVWIYTTVKWYFQGIPSLNISED